MTHKFLLTLASVLPFALTGTLTGSPRNGNALVVPAEPAVVNSLESNDNADSRKIARAGTLLASVSTGNPAKNTGGVGKKMFDPTFRDVAYGPHPRNRLDFWKADSPTPTPVVFYIHGGGWGSGSKEENEGPYLNLMKDGVSYVSINYRLARGADKLPCSVHDAARALQFIRSKAKEWNIDPHRIIATGGSAGGCSSLWLACHDDMANPKSTDPVERQSTRLLAAAVISAQTTIDPMIIKKRIGPSATSHPMIWRTVGAQSEKDLFDHWDKYKALSLECSPLTHLTKDDSPVYLSYSDDSPKPIHKNGIHHAEFGRIMKEASDAIGHKCSFVVISARERQEDLDAFMLRTFQDSKRK